MSLDTAAGVQAELDAVDAAIAARDIYISEYGMFGTNGKRTVYRSVEELLNWRGWLSQRLDALNATEGVGSRRTYMSPKSWSW